MLASETALHRIRDIEIIDVRPADLIRDPGVVRDVLGRAMQYSATIETEVPISGDVAERILPNMDEQLEEFFDYWYLQEAAHGEGQNRVLDHIELEPIESPETKSHGFHRALGKVAASSETAHMVLESLIMGHMALGEKETVVAYTAYARILAEAGEIDLARLFGAYARHERDHLGFQSARGHETYLRLGAMAGGKFLSRIPGRALIHSYSPVGLNPRDEERPQHFVHLLDVLADDGGEKLADQLGELAHEMFPNIPPDHPFAHKMYLDLRSRANAAQAAA